MPTSLIPTANAKASKPVQRISNNAWPTSRQRWNENGPYVALSDTAAPDSLKDRFVRAHQQAPLSRRGFLLSRPRNFRDFGLPERTSMVRARQILLCEASHAEIWIPTSHESAKVFVARAPSLRWTSPLCLRRHGNKPKQDRRKPTLLYRFG